MDYSLLIGVRRRNFEILDSQTTVTKDLSAINLQSLQGNPFNQDVDGAFHAAVVEGQGTFYIGVIDVLQEWNWKKYIERMLRLSFCRRMATVSLPLSHMHIEKGLFSVLYLM